MKGVRASVCHSAKNDDKDYGKVPSHDATFSTFSYAFLHDSTCAFDDRASCRKNISGSAVAILQTCSQIYSEAALLPFTETTFSFYCDSDLSPFINSLVPAQAQAIEKILLAKAGYYDFVSDNIWRRLTGLQKLKIVLPIPAFGQVTCPRSTLRSPKILELQSSTGRMRFDCFQRLNLESFEINVIACYQPMYLQPAFTRFQLLAKAAEKEVLKGWHGPAEVVQEEESEASSEFSFQESVRRRVGKLARLLKDLGLKETRLGLFLERVKERAVGRLNRVWKLSE